MKGHEAAMHDNRKTKNKTARDTGASRLGNHEPNLLDGLVSMILT